MPGTTCGLRLYDGVVEVEGQGEEGALLREGGVLVDAVRHLEAYRVVWEVHPHAEPTCAGRGTFVRGVSHNADEHKGQRRHELASRDAAHVLSQLLPYLC